MRHKYVVKGLYILNIASMCGKWLKYPRNRLYMCGVCCSDMCGVVIAAYPLLCGVVIAA